MRLGIIHLIDLEGSKPLIHVHSNFFHDPRTYQGSLLVCRMTAFASMGCMEARSSQTEHEFLISSKDAQDDSPLCWNERTLYDAIHTQDVFLFFTRDSHFNDGTTKRELQIHADVRLEAHYNHVLHRLTSSRLLFKTYGIGPAP